MTRGRLIDRAEVVWEHTYPAAIGLACLAATWIWGPAAFKTAKLSAWHVDQLYVGVFTVSTVLTGFLFAFYTFISTSDRGFLGRAKKTVYYRIALRYFLTAMLGGGLTIALSLPFMIVQPAPEVRGLSLLGVATWTAVAAFSLAAAERATRIFAIFTSQIDH